MTAGRVVFLVLLSMLLLAGAGPSCVVGFFVFQCASDLDCTPQEFCDVNGTCVAIQFLKETDTCLVEGICDVDALRATQDSSASPTSMQTMNHQPDQDHEQGEPDQETEN